VRLIISTPASIISAIANGAKSGILFKGGAHIEQTVEIDTIAFDKTGTLTLGEPAVVDILPYNSENHTFDNSPELLNRLLSVAAGCEQHSEHHLAEAILAKAREMGIDPVQVENMEATPGQGVSASLNGVKVSVGNAKMFSGEIPTWNPIDHGQGG
jgi:Zn2+/Cd2+-exporting ATPase